MRFLGLVTIVASLSVACSSGDEPTFRPTRTDRGGGAEGDRSGAEGERAEATPTPAPSGPPDLMNPASLSARAPDTFAVELDTTEGPIVLDVTRAWAPNGADRFYNLVVAGFYTDVAFFRVLDGFMCQAGISGDPALARVWSSASIPDDPVVQHNTRGMVSFAMGGPNSRTTQFFISYGDNTRLDGMGFPPFARVRDMTAADRLYSAYGEGAPSGTGPAQARINREGNPYLRASFPELDYIRSARILP